MIVVFSPHADDAIWSLGAHLATLPDVVIVSPFCGIPADPVGRLKHETMNAEHNTACDLIGVRLRHIGWFLDDVYPDAPRTGLREWLAGFLTDADTVYIPLGIDHPDHVMVSDLLFGMLDEFPGRVMVYEELPYRVEHWDKVGDRLIGRKLVGPMRVPAHDLKRAACVTYASQTNHYGTDALDEGLMEMLLQDEIVWG